MELVSKIFETLEISQLALLQLGLVVLLAFLLSTLLIRPILRTFEERENLSVKPIEESRRLLVEADEKARGYDEALRKGAAEALARKRRVMEETSRAGRRQVEAVIEETNLKVEELKGRIAAEKESSAAFLRDQVAQLSVEIARKVLGRPVA
jgi:F-type H+-transporting ATPase subunit b